MMKNLFFSFFLLCSLAVSAQSGFAVVAAEDVNFRKLPETTGELIRKVKLGTLAKVLEGPVEKGNNMNWYKVQIGTQVGWMSADFVFQLTPLTELAPDVVRAYEYLPFVASSLDESNNFMVMIKEDGELNVNSKCYPVRITTASKVKAPKSYRDKYLSLGQMVVMNRILFYNMRQDNSVALVFNHNLMDLNSLYAFEFTPKLAEGVFDADLKYAYFDGYAD
jgi:uncharacterized protein YgiM (DUF1202 family)